MKSNTEKLQPSILLVVMGAEGNVIKKEDIKLIEKYTKETFYFDPSDKGSVVTLSEKINSLEPIKNKGRDLRDLEKVNMFQSYYDPF